MAKVTEQGAQIAHLDSTAKSNDQAISGTAKHLDETITDSAPTEVAKAQPGFAQVWKNRRVLCWCLLIYILPINFGYEASLLGNTLATPAFLRRFGNQTPSGGYEIPTQYQQLWYGAAMIGIFVAAFTAGFLSDMIGRRLVVYIGCVLCIIGVFVQTFTTSAMVIFGGKLISTLGFGLGHALAPVFVAEIAPDEVRGICLALINSMIVIGGWSCSLVAYGGSFINNDWAWRMPFLTQLVPPVTMLVLAVPLLPESPSWLIMRGRREEALAALRKFNGPDSPDIETKLAVLEEAAKQQQALAQEKSSYLDCFKGTDRRRTTIILMAFLSQQFGGSLFISGYLASSLTPFAVLLTIAGVQNPLGIAQGANAIQLFGNICSWFLIDRVGRRPMIVYGMMIMTGTLLIIGCLAIPTGTPQTLAAMVAMMTIWGWLYQATLGAVSFAVGGETPTARLRQKTYSINIMVTTAAGAMVSQVLPYLINPTSANLGGKVAFVFFGLSLPLCFYFFFCLPEMKGRSYLELEELFRLEVPARKFKDYKVVAVVDTSDGKSPVEVRVEGA